MCVWDSRRVGREWRALLRGLRGGGLAARHGGGCRDADVPPPRRRRASGRITAPGASSTAPRLPPQGAYLPHRRCGGCDSAAPTCSPASSRPPRKAAARAGRRARLAFARRRATTRPPRRLLRVGSTLAAARAAGAGRGVGRRAGPAARGGADGGRDGARAQPGHHRRLARHARAPRPRAPPAGRGRAGRLAIAGELAARRPRRRACRRAARRPPLPGGGAAVSHASREQSIGTRKGGETPPQRWVDARGAAIAPRRRLPSPAVCGADPARPRPALAPSVGGAAPILPACVRPAQRHRCRRRRPPLPLAVPGG